MQGSRRLSISEYVSDLEGLKSYSSYRLQLYGKAYLILRIYSSRLVYYLFILLYHLFNGI